MKYIFMFSVYFFKMQNYFLGLVVYLDRMIMVESILRFGGKQF